MLTKQTITMVGMGTIGKEMVACMAGGNFHLLICDEDMGHAEELVRGIRQTQPNCDVEAMQCSFDCAWEADIIVLTMNFDGQQTVAELIKDVVCRKILVSLVDKGEDASKQLSALEAILPYTRIVTLSVKEEPFKTQGCSAFAKSFIAMGKEAESVEEIYDMLETATANTGH